MRDCSIENCNEKHKGLGYCVLHYKRFKKWGDPLYVPERKRMKKIYTQCQIEGCKSKYYAGRFCPKHRSRFTKFGDPLKLKRNPIIGCKWGFCNKKHYAKGYCCKHYARYYISRSSNNGDLFLWVSMNRVRKRDNNSCKWFGCKNNYLNNSIHVHHIFPKSEYPHLKYIEDYMICYCKQHHKEWHKARGDNCHSFL
ncbi:MAG: hypothetical protein R3321_07060 [Nitrososphaeraceae archaeon]|nr:hypothetical protein [Nitrososphaeraceae archaeon]